MLIQLTVEDYEDMGFDRKKPLFEAVIAEMMDSKGEYKPIGFAIYFLTFSTW